MASTTRRASIAVVAALAVTVGVLAQPSPAQTPDYFPDGHELDTSAYTLRLAGQGRAETASTLALVSVINRGTTAGYPFHQADDSDERTAYGFGVCPTAVVVVAQDDPADALASASLKDLVLTIEGRRIDTGNAVLVLTGSGRQGATALPESTREALDTITGACDDPFDALVLGGTAAVPASVFNEVNEVARNVVRIAGTNRFDTARRIAAAVAGTAGLPNVVVHEGTGAGDRRTLLNTVVLAEGFTGADALAVGPYAAHQNLPLLLTSSGGLPTETAAALTSLAPQNILVLGGTNAIPEEVAEAAATAAGGATVTRIAGETRAHTSVLIAQQLFGHLAGRATTGTGGQTRYYSNLAVGIARSEGRAAQHVGWPDALASAFFLDTYDTAGATPPERLAPAVEQNTLGLTIGGIAPGAGVAAPSTVRLASPLLLVNRDGVPPVVQEYLESLWPSSSDMIVGAHSQPSPPTGSPPENHGGFGFVFGGAGAVGAGPVGDVALALSGGTYEEDRRSDVGPSLTGGQVFFTAMGFPDGYTNESPDPGVHADGEVSAGAKVCAYRNALAGSEWLALYGADGSFRSAAPVAYQGAGTAYAADQSRFVCVPAGTASRAHVRGVSLSGHETATVSLDWSSASGRLATTTAGTAGAPTRTPTSPISGGCDPRNPDSTPPTGSETTRTCTFTYDGTMSFNLRGTSHTGRFVLTLQFTRTTIYGPGQPQPKITFTGGIDLWSQAQGGSLLGRASLIGESTEGGAVMPSPSPSIEDMSLVGFYSLGGQRGGFRALVDEDGPLSDLFLDGLG